jgi:hypothetical protein
LGKKERNGRQNAPKNTPPAKDGVPSLLKNIFTIWLFGDCFSGFFYQFLVILINDWLCQNYHPRIQFWEHLQDNLTFGD